MPDADVPVYIDTTKASIARVYDAFLNGKDNYEIDREVLRRVQQVAPEARTLAFDNRNFLIRVTRFIAGQTGITQYLDCGSGLPTAENTHQVAQRIQPEARVVYIDNDPVVLAHARALLRGSAEGFTTYVDADLHEPEQILRTAARSLDLDRPVALMLMNILGHVPDLDDARAIVGRLLDALPAGSHLAVADGTNVIDGEAFDAAIAIWNQAGSLPYHLRRPEQIAGFFTGLELVEPGVVSCPLWRPGTTDVGAIVPVDEFCAVGRKVA